MVRNNNSVRKSLAKRNRAVNNSREGYPSSRPSIRPLMRLNKNNKVKGGFKSLFVKKAPRVRPAVNAKVSPKELNPSVTAWAKRGAKLLAAGLIGFVVLGLVSVLLVAGYLYFSKSDYFAVRHLKITGLGHLTMDEVLKASGLDRPVNNLTFDAKAAVSGLSGLPWVEEASVSRVLPDGLLVTVKEYQPKALVSLDQLYYLDEKGRAFKKLDPGENPDLPIISGFSLDELVSGGPLVMEGLKEAFSLMDILEARTDDFRLDSVSEINYDHDIGLTVFTRRSGLKLRVGFGSYLEKFRRLGRVMAHLKVNGQAAGLAFIHLETPPRVVLRYNNEI